MLMQERDNLFQGPLVIAMRMLRCLVDVESCTLAKLPVLT
jgi:hypothetical protein